MTRPRAVLLTGGHSVFVELSLASALGPNWSRFYKHENVFQTQRRCGVATRATKDALL